MEKLFSFHVPMVIFGEQRVPYLALDAYEYLHDKGNVHIALDYEDLKAKVKVCGLQKILRGTKVLALSTDLPAYEQGAVLRNPQSKQIMERFGIQVEHVKHAELIEKWGQTSEKAVVDLAKKWLREAYRIVEPKENDLVLEAKLYLTVKKLVEERSAVAVTIVCSDQIAPLPAPCFAFAKLRDEGIPAGCEADLTSLLMLLLVQKLCQRPAFMGNVLVVNPEEETLAISH
jgi:L-fucose isomerase-like protein